MRRRGPFEDEVLRVIGERIRELREERRLSIRELADELGVSDSAVYNAETGNTCSVTFLYRLADHWDCSLDDLCPVVTVAA